MFCALIGAVCAVVALSGVQDRQVRLLADRLPLGSSTLRNAIEKKL